MDRKQKFAVLDIFNRAVADDSKPLNSEAVKSLVRAGVCVTGACDADLLLEWLRQKQFNPNTTFYTTIGQVASLERWELLIDQLVHYFSTYGTNYEGVPFIVNDKPILFEKNSVRVIETISEQEAVGRSLDMLYSGAALKQDTIKLILTITGDAVDIEKVRNREALCIICAQLDRLPENPVEALRCLIYRATNKSLLIKDKSTIEAIKLSSVIISQNLVESLSPHFHRFKPLLLAFKHNRASSINAQRINKMRKLADKNHKPLPKTFWNNLFNVSFENINKTFETVQSRIAELNPLKIVALYNLVEEKLINASIHTYVIRNGKLWVETEDVIPLTQEMRHYLESLRHFFKQTLIEHLRSKEISEMLLPEGISLMCPTSEKSFMGEIPMYSYVTLDNDIHIGINWRGAEGAQDLDISMISSDGVKFGWNADYYNQSKGFVYSGDMTTANPEATEILYRAKLDDTEGIVKVSPYYLTQRPAKFRVFVAKERPVDFKENYMVHPDSIIYSYEDTIDCEKVIGVVLGDKLFFCNLKTSSKVVSGSSITDLQFDYLAATWASKLQLSILLQDADIQVKYSKDVTLSRDTILRLFT